MDVNRIQGDVSRYTVLSMLHELVQPKIYLEIGILNGLSLKLSKCKSYGVDPNPLIESYDNKHIFRMTSDEFFASQRIEKPDLIFIDGLHLSEQVMKDFINCERISKPTTVIAIDDIYPNCKEQAERVCITKKWAGDVWKLLPALQKYRTDLKIVSLNNYPTGMILITNLNPKSDKAIIIESDESPNENIFNRVGVEKDSKKTILEFLNGSR
jgi:hypothetical protein